MAEEESPRILEAGKSRWATSSDMMVQVAPYDATEVALHRYVVLRRGLPLQDAVGVGALDGEGGELGGLQQALEVGDGGAEEGAERTGVVLVRGRHVIRGVETIVGVKHQGSAMVQ